MAAQFIAMFEGDLWERCARSANEKAADLAARAAALPGVTVTQSVEANEIFAVLPEGAIAPLQKRWRFYTWDEAKNEIRWVTSWDTTPQDIDELIADLTALLPR